MTLTACQLAFAFTIMMIIAYGCIKLSALFFYKRLFVPSSRTIFGRILTGTIALIVCWTIALLFVYIFGGCGRHVDALWGNVILAAEECPHGFEAEMALFASDLATDVIVLVLPLPTVSRLGTPPQYC